MSLTCLWPRYLMMSTMGCRSCCCSLDTAAVGEGKLYLKIGFEKKYRIFILTFFFVEKKQEIMLFDDEHDGVEELLLQPGYGGCRGKKTLFFKWDFFLPKISKYFFFQKYSNFFFIQKILKNILFFLQKFENCIFSHHLHNIIDKITIA